MLSLLLRAVVPFAWVGIAFVPDKFLKKKTLYFFSVVLACAALSLFIQPVITLTCLVGLAGFVLGSHSSRQRYDKRIHSLETVVDGESNTERLMFFMHGWPDTADLWQKQVDAFKGDFRCVRYSLPFFSTEGRADATWAPRWGFDLEDSMEMIHDALEAAKADCKPTDVTIVAHDWGAVIAAMLKRKYPKAADRVCIVDVSFPVGPAPPPQSLVALSVMGMVYQWWCALAFVVDTFVPYVGTKLADKLLGAFARNMSIDVGHQEFPTPRAASTYFYFHMQLQGFKDMVTRGSFDQRHRVTSEVREACKNVPVFFAFGADKAFMFHGGKFPEKLNERKNGSRAIGYGDKKDKRRPKIGHWVTLTATEKFNKDLSEWVESVAKQQREAGGDQKQAPEAPEDDQKQSPQDAEEADPE